MQARAIEQKILAMLRERGPDKTACPSEIARALDGDRWRALMRPVRDAAGRLAAQRRIEITQQGKRVAADARGPIRFRLRPAPDAYAARYRDVDFRKHPELYRIGRGEQGVLIAEPYKTELLPLWRFRTEEIARESSAALLAKFGEYKRAKDFVGMDMARKYLQMGFTRARRYANHPGGKKYDEAGRTLQPSRERQRPDQKTKAAAVFKQTLDRVLADRTYARLRELHLAKTKGIT